MKLLEVVRWKPSLLIIVYHNDAQISIEIFFNFLIAVLQRFNDNFLPAYGN